jgi:hypothetical protein
MKHADLASSNYDCSRERPGLYTTWSLDNLCDYGWNVSSAETLVRWECLLTRGDRIGSSRINATGVRDDARSDLGVLGKRGNADGVSRLIHVLRNSEACMESLFFGAFVGRRDTVDIH